MAKYPGNLPNTWHERLKRYVVQPHTGGCSDASVWRVAQPDNAPVWFIKSEPVTPLAELPGEAARLRWLAQAGVPCAPVLDTATTADRHWLLQSAGRQPVARQGQPGAGNLFDRTAEAVHGVLPARHHGAHRIARQNALGRHLDGRVIAALLRCRHRGIVQADAVARQAQQIIGGHPWIDDFASIPAGTPGRRATCRATGAAPMACPSAR